MEGLVNYENLHWQVLEFGEGTGSIQPRWKGQPFLWNWEVLGYFWAKLKISFIQNTSFSTKVFRLAHMFDPCSVFGESIAKIMKLISGGAILDKFGLADLTSARCSCTSSFKNVKHYTLNNLVDRETLSASTL